MILLALRNLVSEKTRFAFSAAGIGFAVFLITIMLGLYQGWNNKVGAFVEQVDADAWVAREGTTDFLNAASILPRDQQATIEAMDGVESVHAMIVRPMGLDRGEKTIDTHLIGYDVASGIGGPLKIVRGRGEPSGNEIVVDEVLSRTKDIGVGDVLRSGETQLEVIGIATGGNFAFVQASFMDVEAVSALLEMDGLATFFVVKMEEGADVAQWQADFEEQTTEIVTYTSDEFAQATRHRILNSVVPIIGLIVGLAFIVGIAITSLTIYTATVEKTREFGVMKAVGFNNVDLYKLVFVQSVLTGFLGFAFGVALTLILSQFIDRLVAQFIVLVRPIDVAFVLIATLLMAIGAAVVPARRVGSVDPAVVFRG